MSKKKIKDIYIDADHLIYTVALAQGTNATLGGSKVSMSDTKVNIKAMKAHFKKYVKDFVKSVEVLSITEKWTVGKTYLIYSDKTNFRYDIFPAYKCNRDDSEKTPQFLKLRKWCHKHGIIHPNTEADDVVSYYVMQGHIGITSDKDMLKGVKGIWYDTYHQCWVNRTQEECDRFVLLQTIMGDSGDDIIGCPFIGKTNVEKFLYEPTWRAVVNAFRGVIPPRVQGMPFYKKDGTATAVIMKIRKLRLTEQDAILNRRLVSMTQWHPKHGIRLWEP